jgi:CDP-glucose 4,6-dehydratase
LGFGTGAVEDLVTSAWKGVRVFLTGHTGFKGGWLALWLASKGAIVRGYALDPSTSPSLFEVARVGELIEDVRGDIRDRIALDLAMREFAPDVIFHLAAQPLVRPSYADPVGTYATNVLGTAHVLEAARGLASVRAIVVVTSDKCYENQEWHWGYRESDRLGGHDPYSSSKACAEIVCAAYRSSFFHAAEGSSPLLATARAGNVIGGGDWSQDRLIPDLIRGFLRADPVLIRRPHSIRPWQHVIEPLAGYIALAERLLACETLFAAPWNFGPYDDDAWPVERIAKTMAERWGSGASWIVDSTRSVHEAGYLKLDSSKALAELRWHPQLRLNTALDWVVDWYRAWNGGSDMQVLTLNQIGEYDSIALEGTLKS